MFFENDKVLSICIGKCLLLVCFYRFNTVSMKNTHDISILIEVSIRKH